MLDEMFQRNASNFAIFLEYENTCMQFFMNEKQNKKLHGFSFSKNMANFEAFLQVISSSINPLFLKIYEDIVGMENKPLFMHKCRSYFTVHIELKMEKQCNKEMSARVVGAGCTITSTIFRNKRFMLDEMTQRNASKFAIFLEYKNPCSIHQGKK